MLTRYRISAKYFYPRSPCGERPPPYNLMIQHAKISIHALLAESDSSIEEVSKYVVISIHALLAESDARSVNINPPRIIISIHALLAESDCQWRRSVKLFRHFYPRSPCGERPWARGSRITYVEISIHALLAESDVVGASQGADIEHISIHALLAESDGGMNNHIKTYRNFYPRSPCGERQKCEYQPTKCDYFYPRSPCGERPVWQRPGLPAENNFYPRSPCGERLFYSFVMDSSSIFLSTLSLRRATY